MLEKMNQLAEDAATSVSRRGFLRRLGQNAAAASAVICGLLTSRSVSAGKKGGQLYVCLYENGQSICDTRCKGKLTWRDRLTGKRQSTTLVSKTAVDSCPT